MKARIIALFITTLPLGVSAQDIDENIQEGEIEEELLEHNALQSYTIFTYDACGNRIKRISRISSHPISKTKKSPTPSVKSQPTGCDITIHNWNAGCSGRVSIYNTSGQQILSKPITNATTSVNLETQPNGVYIIKIDFNGRITTKEYIKK
ncbi:MAG: T9SS type A sorting domain-containing protein [Prevotella sp.]|nr:T9SS type A sorting domain-containing protein [Prevotella sp.]MBQ9652150.1 T9SS type A sorting domain-containing protein [Prevotella sp.]